MNVAELVALIAKESAIPEKRVALYARRLREADLLPQSKGRFYPEVSPEHCARLLVALLAAENPQHAASAVQDYENLIGIVTHYLTNMDIEWLKRIGVERNTGAAFFVRGGRQESLFDEEVDTELPAVPKSLEGVVTEVLSRHAKGDFTKGTQELGHGRFRLVAEFDEIVLATFWAAFPEEKIEARWPGLMEEIRSRKKEE